MIVVGIKDDFFLVFFLGRFLFSGLKESMGV